MYIYGLVSSDFSHTGSGIGGSPVYPYVVNGIAALVSENPPQEVSPKEAMLDHTRVVADVFAQTPILPAQAGLTASLGEIHDYLQNNCRQLLAALDRLRDKFEAKVRGVYKQDVTLRELMQLDPKLARAGAGFTAQLQVGQRVAALLVRHRLHDQKGLLQELVPLAQRIATHSEEGFTMINASFLVPRANGEKFTEALERYAQSQRERIEFHYVAPLAPYSFVD